MTPWPGCSSACVRLAYSARRQHWLVASRYVTAVFHHCGACVIFILPIPQCQQLHLLGQLEADGDGYLGDADGSLYNIS